MNTFDSWNSSLYHWGIPGMKHGRRRYQNEDGTWTEEGLALRRVREGYGKVKEGVGKAGKSYKQAAEFISGKKQGELRGAISSAPGKIGDTVGGVGRIASRVSRQKSASKQYEVARKMSDAELQKVISRMNLERQYVSLTTKDTSQGWELARETLGVIGGLTAITLASMQIYQGLRK